MKHKDTGKQESEEKRQRERRIDIFWNIAREYQTSLSLIRSTLQHIEEQEVIKNSPELAEKLDLISEELNEVSGLTCCLLYRGEIVRKNNDKDFADGKKREKTRVIKNLSKVDKDFLKRVNDVIAKNFDKPEFSMEEVFAATGLSRTTFYRRMRELSELNPVDYIRMKRLNKAKKLFLEGHTSVSEVGYQVGFSSPGYFTKCFHKEFGISPKDYILELGKKVNNK